MRQEGKAGIIILVILLILALAGAGIGFYSFQKERLKVIRLNGELESLKVQRRIAENKLAESTKKIDELNSQLETDRTQIKELNSKLERVEAENNQLDSRIAMLESQLQEQEEIKGQWEAKQIQAQEKINELQALLHATKDELEAQSKKLKRKEEVALGKIVVEQNQTVAGAPSTELTQSQSRPPLEGKVLVINKDYNFAVINLGSQDGIDAADLFSVYHNDSYIGDIRIDKIQEMMSACAFVSEEVKDKIREGDKVIRK